MCASNLSNDNGKENTSPLQSGRYDEAEQLCRRLLAEREAALGTHHPRSLSIKNDLGFILKNQGKLEEAEKVYRDILAMEEMADRNDGRRSLAIKNNLALVLRNRGKFTAAERMH